MTLHLELGFFQFSQVIMTLGHTWNSQQGYIGSCLVSQMLGLPEN